MIIFYQMKYQDLHKVILLIIGKDRNQVNGIGFQGILVF